MSVIPRWLGYSAVAAAALALLIFGGLVVASSLSFANRPRIACESPVFDFGVVAGETEISHEFQIVNRGGRTLEILDVRKSCSCLAVDVPDVALEPNEAVKVKVSMSLWGRKGKLEQQILIACNDPEVPLYVMIVKGDSR